MILIDAIIFVYTFRNKENVCKYNNYRVSQSTLSVSYIELRRKGKEMSVN